MSIMVSLINGKIPYKALTYDQKQAIFILARLGLQHPPSPAYRTSKSARFFIAFISLSRPHSSKEGAFVLLFLELFCLLWTHFFCDNHPSTCCHFSPGNNWSAASFAILAFSSRRCLSFASAWFFIFSFLASAEGCSITLNPSSPDGILSPSWARRSISGNAIGCCGKVYL